MLRRVQTERSLFDLEVFAILGESDRSSLIDQAQFHTFYSRQNLLGRGEKFGGLIVVCAGTIEASSTSANKKRLMFQHYCAGDLIGLRGVSGLLDSECDYNAQSDGSLMVIPFDAIRSMMRRDSEFGLLLMERLGQEASQLRELAERIALQDSQGRLAHWLLRRFDQFEDGTDAFLNLTQSQVAAQIGTVREVVSRSLASFEKQEWISTQDRHLRINNRDKLEAMAQYIKAELTLT